MYNLYIKNVTIEWPLSPQFIFESCFFPLMSDILIMLILIKIVYWLLKKSLFYIIISKFFRNYLVILL